MGGAEKLVHQLFHLAQGRAQLAHHTAHGLAVADSAVQVFHPGFQRLGYAAGLGALQALGQMYSPGCRLPSVSPQLFESRLQIEHSGCHLHGQRGSGRLARGHHRSDDLGQRLGQRRTVRAQLVQRITDQAELVCRRTEFVAVTTGHGRPGFGHGGNTFLGLGQRGGIEAAETAHLVVQRREAVQPEGGAHRLQRRCIGCSCSRCLGAEKQDVLHQAVRHTVVAPHKTCVLQQYTRGHTLHIHVGR